MVTDVAPLSRVPHPVFLQQLSRPELLPALGTLDRLISLSSSLPLPCVAVLHCAVSYGSTVPASRRIPPGKCYRCSGVCPCASGCSACSAGTAPQRLTGSSGRPGHGSPRPPGSLPNCWGSAVGESLPPEGGLLGDETGLTSDW